MPANLKVAVITQVFNEDFFLPVWLNHYGKIFGFNNLIIIDDGSFDGSTNDVRIKRLVRKERTPLDEADRALLISLFHEELLKYYDVVIYTDCDELIVIDPLINIGLRDYIIKLSFNSINVIGFNILHDRVTEAKINLGLSLFSQRRFVRFDSMYCKPLLSKVPIRWSPGFHGSNKERVFDDNLFMFHLRSIDYEYSRRRIKALNSIEFSTESLSSNFSSHFRSTEKQYLELLYTKMNEELDWVFASELKDVFYNNLRLQDGRGSTVAIPERFVNVIDLSAAIFNDDPNGDVLNLEYKLSPKKLSKIRIQQLFDECLVKLQILKRRRK
jgi:hypothetical protein